MRVIGGAHRGRRLTAPRGTATRPTLGRVREALFDILGPGIRDTRALDLFAGTGAVGIEALSRGAARVVFVERDRAALSALRRNLAALAAPRARARVVAGEALAVLPLLARTEVAFDLVFVDPPYTGDLAAKALGALVAHAVLRPRARVIVQHFAKAPVPAVVGLQVRREPRRFGDTALTFLEAEEYTPPDSGP